MLIGAVSRDPLPQLGFVSALSAFLIWGLLPLYWGQFSPTVPPSEVLAHRIIWTALMTVAVLVATGHLKPFAAVLRDPRQLGWGLLASLLISGNGLTFIWAVGQNRVTEISLGYYINPLLNMLLGFVVLRERPNALQGAGIAVAATGVAYMAIRDGQLPWPSLVVAGCFGFYGLVRKTAPLPPLTGLAVEMSIAAPIAVAFLFLAPAVPGGAFMTSSVGMKILLVLTGIATAVPLWLFSTGARRLPYMTIGVLMFVAPSIQLALAIFVNGEPFDPVRGLTFGCIWVAIVLYLLGSYLRLTSVSTKVDSVAQRA